MIALHKSHSVLWIVLNYLFIHTSNTALRATEDNSSTPKTLNNAPSAVTLGAMHALEGVVLDTGTVTQATVPLVGGSVSPASNWNNSVSRKLVHSIYLLKQTTVLLALGSSTVALLLPTLSFP